MDVVPTASKLVNHDILDLECDLHANSIVLFFMMMVHRHGWASYFLMGGDLVREVQNFPDGGSTTK